MNEVRSTYFINNMTFFHNLMSPIVHKEVQIDPEELLDVMAQKSIKLDTILLM